MKSKLLFYAISISLGFLLLNPIARVHAATPSITIDGFDVTPKSIPYAVASDLTYTFSLSTPSASATKDYCSSSANFATGDIDWLITDTTTVQPVANGTIAADDFTNSLHVSKTSTFSFGGSGVTGHPMASNQTVANFQLVISCKGTISFSQITKSAIVPVNITGQYNTTGVTIAFGSDKTDQHVAPNTQLPVNFQFDMTSSQAALTNKCGTNTNDPKLAYSIYQFSLASPGDRSNPIFTSAISFSSFGTGSTEKNTIPITLNVPGNDIGFVGQVRCNGTSLGESSQITIYAGGSGSGSKYSCNTSNQCVTDPNGTYTTSNCDSKCGSGGGSGGGATSSKSYSFKITNPLNGGPNNLFDIINIVTNLLLQLSIPIAVIMILWAGFLMLTAGAVPAKFEQGKKILTYTIMGLAVIFIGRGFITLIYSIIQLGGSSPQTTQTISVNYNCSSNATCIALPAGEIGTYSNISDCQQQCEDVTGPHVCINSVCSNGVVGPCQSDSDCVASGPPPVQQYQNILTIDATPSSSTAPINQPYQVLLSVENPTDGGVSINWAPVSGSLPPGMTLTTPTGPTEGQISGTPTKAGTYSFTVQGMDITNKQYGRVDVKIIVQ